MTLQEGEHCPTCGSRVKRLYFVWNGIKTRCYNPSAPNYHNYGGRGIKMCERWKNSYEAFVEDVGPRPGTDYTIDRIDNDGDYEPNNVRWVTMTEQHRNTRRNVMVTWQGETKPLAVWAEELGMSKQALANRLRKWPLDEAMTRSPNDGRRNRKRLMYDQRYDAGNGA